MSDMTLTCAQCDELFPDYFEGDLDEARRAALDAHAATCARCQGLIRDIRGITQNAASLADIAPSRNLWKGIEERIQPPVLAIRPLREGMHISKRVLGLAAAFLVVISSSITYVATRGTPITSKRPVRVVEAPRDVPVPGASDEIGAPSPSITVPAPGEQPATSEAPQPKKSAAPAAGKQPSLGGTTRSASTSLASAQRVSTVAEKAIAPEIAQLQSLLKQRRSQLDPSTVKIVEDNLAVIDAAVKQAREALMKDPASGFLSEQLDNVLQKKVQLLRTAASLPSRS